MDAGLGMMWRKNSESLCLDAAVSALSSCAGEQKLFEEYLISVQQLDENLQDRYHLFLQGISESMKQFMDILDRAFSPECSDFFPSFMVKYDNPIESFRRNADYNKGRLTRSERPQTRNC